MTEANAPIAITGIGIVSPLGIGREPFWQALLAGNSALSASNGTAPPTARIQGFDWREWVQSPNARRMDELSRCVIAASRMAQSDAGLQGGDVEGDRLGIVLGSAYGNLTGTVEFLTKLFTKGPALASPMLFPTLVLNAPASQAAMEFGATGSNLTVSQLEVSGEHAIALGCDLIRRGRADVVVAGGADEISDILHRVFSRMSALAGQRGGRVWSSPYDRNRSGVLLGEGVAMVVLESPDHARRRGASCIAEIHGDFAAAVPATAFDWPDDARDAAARLHSWLDGQSAIRPDLVVGCGNSSRRLDACELTLLAELFGAQSSATHLTSIRGATGEFASAGAMSIATAALALHHQVIPPLPSLESPAAENRFALASTSAQPAQLDAAMTLGIARGGALAATYLRRGSR